MVQELRGVGSCPAWPRQPTEASALGRRGVTGASLPWLDGRRIVVVDDGPLLADALHLLLADLGADVMLASDGADGLELADRHRPDFILCDLRMPRLDCPGFVRRIREDPRLSSRLDGILPKPFRSADVSAVLRLASARRPAA